MYLGFQEGRGSGRSEESSGDYDRVKNQELRIMNTKKRIYILHGWTYSTERWKPFVKELEKHGFEIDLLKIPGLTAPLSEVWDIDNYIEWLRKTLGKEEGKVILLGHSNGGLISLGFTLKYPEKVEKLILVDSTGIYHKELGIRLKRWLFKAAAGVGTKLTKSAVLRKYLYKMARAHDYERANPLARKIMKKLIRVDYSQVLNKINVPTIIIWGENDQVTPVRDGKIMNSTISRSSLYIVKNARHSPQLTHPVKTAEILVKNI
jgi:pimeloyl-ACP methyl ester carboxylesterase